MDQALIALQHVDLCIIRVLVFLNVRRHILLLSQLRRRLCKSSPEIAAEQGGEGVKLLAAGEVFREQVCWVHLTLDLAELERLRANLFLHPQCVSFKVPELPEAGARAYAQRCARVSPNSNRDFAIQVSQ